MINIHPKGHKAGWPAVLVLVLLASGCAGEPAIRKEDFFEKWETVAKESAGHSPAPRTRVVIMPDKTTPAGTPEVQEAPVKSLPTDKITLKMRQADTKAVLRSLARVSGQNILIKNDIKGDVSVDFRDVPWDQAFVSILNSQSLSYVWEGDIIRVQSVDDMEQALKLTAAQDKRKVQQIEVKAVEPLATMVVNVDYADADMLKDDLVDLISKDKEGKLQRGSVRVDRNTNALIVQAIREDIERMIPIIEKIDKPTAQINIKANIVETSKDTARNLGIQWGGLYGRTVAGRSLFVTPGGSGPPPTNPTAYTPTSAASGSAGTTGTTGTTGTGIGGQGFGVNFPAAGLGPTASASLGLIFGTIGGNLLEVQLNALQRDNKLNILSSPSITTLDNQKAFTSNGERVPVVSTSQQAGTNVQYIDAVLRLEITPHVIDGKNLRMKIRVQKDEADLSRQVQGNPFIIKKETETTLIVQDGETVVISGLSKQTASNNVSGVPALKDIPGLGWLFKGTGDNDQMQEVLIFITPTILPPQVTAAVEKNKDEAGEKGR